MPGSAPAEGEVLLFLLRIGLIEIKDKLDHVALLQ